MSMLMLGIHVHAMDVSVSVSISLSMSMFRPVSVSMCVLVFVHVSVHVRGPFHCPSARLSNYVPKHESTEISHPNSEGSIVSMETDWILADKIFNSRSKFQFPTNQSQWARFRSSHPLPGFLCLHILCRTLSTPLLPCSGVQCPVPTRMMWFVTTASGLYWRNGLLQHK
jgi:hypothetical protein